MIPALPQCPAPPQRPAAVPQAEPAAPDGFAQIFDTAAKASALVGPPPLANQDLPIVPATTGSEVSVLDPARADKERDAAPASAQVFNANGFFGTPVSADRLQPIQVSALERTPEHQLSENALVPVEELQAGPAPAVQISGPSAVVPAPLLPHRQPATAGAINPPAPRTVPSARAPAEMHEVAEAPKPIASRLATRQPAARSPVQVVLSELDQGLQVAARIDALDDNERVRLHDEIAALLARHGLSANDIRINSRPHPALQEKLK